VLQNLFHNQRLINNRVLSKTSMRGHQPMIKT